MPLSDRSIAYERAGRPGAPTVVLLHAGVADRRMWDPVWEDLTASLDAVRLDLRGVGESDTPPDGAIGHRDDVVALLDELSVASCHLVGASFGAGVAAEVALARPGLAQSVVLAPPGGSLLVTMTDDLRAFVEGERALLGADDLDGAVALNVATWLVGPGRREDEVAPALRDAVARMQRRAFEVEGLLGDAEVDEPDPPAAERLAELRVPVLVLVGDHDLATVHDAADRVVAEVPDAGRVDWADAAHLPSMEHPRRFARLLREWVERVDAAAASASGADGG
ncbi:alpha/beta hydrolase [Arthrobacter sp. NEB 688]|uniref:alpha/beta fold hydrolase n=1 Tax=Arthrobacter sp. NEB 688 TaxID=904039 RepID=UPI001565A705|nr:alpha/beta hydrolase [Arthrobacter sp. NEB 688]QKE83271.1 alpha/beta fold hydrolase [Arthrobacter sp. NEB 688]